MMGTVRPLKKACPRLMKMVKQNAQNPQQIKPTANIYGNPKFTNANPYPNRNTYRQQQHSVDYYNTSASIQ